MEIIGMVPELFIKAMLSKTSKRIVQSHFFIRMMKLLKKNKKFLTDGYNTNNISFSFSDIDMLISSIGNGYQIRLFWHGFDSSWDKTAFDRSKRRLERKI